MWDEKEDRCVPGKLCHDDRQKKEARRLGLTYYDYAWRNARGIAVDAGYSRLPKNYFRELRRRKERLARKLPWCAPKGTRSCHKMQGRSACERVYADHRGDRNCLYRNGRCVPGPKCSDARNRKEKARKLGLTYYGAQWHRPGGRVASKSFYYDLW